MSNSSNKPSMGIEGALKQDISELRQSTKQLRLLTIFLFVPVISVIYLLFF